MMGEMTNRFFIVLSFLGVLFSVSSAFAQSCDVQYELIFRMREPTYGAYNVWDTLYGERDVEERFVSGVYKASENIVLAGERWDQMKGKDSLSLLLVGLGRNGRLQWEKFHEIPGLYEVVKMLPVGDKYLILANIQDKAGKKKVWLGVFDQAGDLLKQNVVADKKNALSAQDIIPAHNGKTFMMVGYLQEGSGQLPAHSVLYQVTETGKILSDPGFLPGEGSKILSLRPIGEKRYIATGYLTMEDGRRAGWVLRLNEHGGVDWQRQYPRGRSSELADSALVMGRYLVVGGLARPSAGAEEHDAGWLMMISSDNGDIGWQRYYTGEVDFAIEDLMTDESGLLSAMMEATPLKGEGPETRGQDYVRMLSVTPRGELFGSDAYFNGLAANGSQLIEGPGGERVIVGSSLVSYERTDPKTGETVKEQSWDGWAVAAETAEHYEDPCIQPFGAVQ